MDFAFNEDQEQLRSINQRFFENEYPLARVREILEQPDSFDRDVWREGAALGWSAMLVPEEFEGGCITDQALVDLVVVAEEMGRFLYPGPFLPVNVVAFAITEFGSELQKKELLPALVRGRLRPPGASRRTAAATLPASACSPRPQPMVSSSPDRPCTCKTRTPPISCW